MKIAFVAALFFIAALSEAAAQPPYHYNNGFRPHFCPAGTSWQYGCVQWGPAAPGRLFGQCVRSAWSCKRVGGPIQ